jgi:hypothetical protein
MIISLAIYDSKKEKRFVCNMFIALVASYASITQEMLISLAPFEVLVYKRAIREEEKVWYGMRGKEGREHTL